jgi:Flp pilus assembly protein TadG
MKLGIYRQRGLAVVEATITLPLMILLILAIAEFGRGLYQYNTLTQAVRASVRTASVVPNDGNFSVEQIESKTKNLVVYGTENKGTTPVLPGLKESDVTVTELEPVGTERYVRVDVSYGWQPIFGTSFNTLVGGTISLDFPLKTSMVMRVL